MEVNIYIGFGTLKMKCTQDGICGQVAFKNARQWFFQNQGGEQQQFSVEYKKSWFSGWAAAPARYFHPRKVCGGNLTSPSKMSSGALAVQKNA